MAASENKYKLILKIIYDKVLFLKYEANTRSPSLCLAAENAIFGRGRKKKSVIP